MLARSSFQHLRVCLHLTSQACSGQWARSLSTAEADGARKLVAAVIMERLPVILPEPPEWEVTYDRWSFEKQQQKRYEFPQSFLDKASSRSGDEEGSGTTFIPAPRTTEADRTGDVRSLERAFDKRLYLIVKGRPPGGPSTDDKWHFLEKVHTQEKSMRECAEAAVSEQVEEGPQIYFVGNAPCGHIGVEAANRFFFRAQLIAGELNLASKDLQDYAWVTKQELSKFVDPEHHEFFNRLLVDY